MSRRAALLAAAGAVVVAGCGSSAPHLSKREFAKRGDAICRSYSAAIAKLGQPTKASELGPFIEQALPLLDRTVKRLSRLAPPAGRDSEFKRFMTAARATVTRARALRAAAQRADGTAVQRLLAQALRASGPRAAAARAAGLGSCALS